jgi:hypothetical protein
VGRVDPLAQQRFAERRVAGGVGTGPVGITRLEAAQMAAAGDRQSRATRFFQEA